MLAKETTKLTFLEPLLQWGIASFFFFSEGMPPACSHLTPNCAAVPLCGRAELVTTAPSSPGESEKSFTGLGGNVNRNISQGFVHIGLRVVAKIQQ